MNIPSFQTQAVNGKGSWFGGPHDPTDSGHTASGGTTKEPGIAVYNRATLGGYWRVTGPNGKTAVVKQTDLGPAPLTGRKIDVTYSALGKFGYNEGNFPTDQQFRATYLGRNAPKGGETQATVPQTPTRGPLATLSAPSRGPAGETTSFNEPGFLKAQKTASANQLLLGMPGGSELRGLLSGKAPLRSEYETKGTEAPSKAAPPILGAKQSGGALSGFIPKGASYHLMRTDQGKDVQLNPGQALLATGDYKVVAVPSDPSGFGPAYPVVQFTSGPDTGHTIYLGHTDSAVRAGQSGHAGDTLAHTSRTGHNAPAGWVEIGLWGPGGPLGKGSGETGAGKEIARLLGR